MCVCVCAYSVLRCHKMSYSPPAHMVLVLGWTHFSPLFLSAPFFFINTQILFATFGLGQKQRLRTGGNKPQDTPRREIGLRFIFFLWQRLCRGWLAFAAGVGARRF